jgi:GNAT superfamily N-acetyltransferase
VSKPQASQLPDVIVRSATDGDLNAITAVALATGQTDEWAGGNPAYVRHLLQHGRVVVAERAGEVVGFGATQQIGSGPESVSMLCDLFVDPAAHGSGLGRAMLANLWAGTHRRMTFSSLHANAIPLYTSFGLDAWWPLLYLRGKAGSGPPTTGWSVSAATAAEVAQRELAWTGVDRLADAEAWAARRGGAGVIVSHDGSDVATGTVITAGPDCGIVHMALTAHADDHGAASAVHAVLAHLGTRDQIVAACLPAPHPAVRPLLAAGWRFSEFDLFMASEPGLLDPRRAIPSPGQA